MKKIPLVYLHIGEEWPEHAATTHKQADLCNAEVVTVLKSGKDCREYNLPEFHNFGFYDGVDSFWGRTVLRLWEVGRIMETNGFDTIVHMENDVFPWRDVNPLFSKMHEIYGDKIACTPLDRSRCTAATLYIGSWDKYREFMHQLRIMLQTPHRKLLDRVDPDIAINEMHLLRLMEWDHSELIQMLPVRPDDQYADALGVWDPAGYGQHIDGIPGVPGQPAHLKGTIVGGMLYRKEASLVWEQGLHGQVPYVINEHGLHVPLQTTHVHTKRIKHVLEYYGKQS